MENNIKNKLVEFNSKLTNEQTEVINIVTNHVTYCDYNSEKEITASLNKCLETYTYFDNVKEILGILNGEINENSLYYKIKDLYYKVARKENSFLYENALSMLLDCLGLNTDEDRKIKVLNELKMYDWIPEVQLFLFEMAETPQAKMNLSSKGGQIEDVYSIVLQIEEGYLAFVHDKWFKFTDKGIEGTLLENHVTDEVQLKKMRLLEQVIAVAEFEGEMINFNVGEGLIIGINSQSGKLFLNGDEADSDTTLESIYNSPVIPFMAKGYYPMMAECVANLKTFVNLDYVKKVSNVLNQKYECYVFNFKNNINQYRLDKFQGSSLMQYESALAIIENVLHDLGIDITFFYENMLSEDLKAKKELEKKEIKLNEKLEEIEEAILKIKDQDKTISEHASIKALYNTLLADKHKISEQLKTVKNEKIKYLS